MRLAYIIMADITLKKNLEEIYKIEKALKEFFNDRKYEDIIDSDTKKRLEQINKILEQKNQGEDDIYRLWELSQNIDFIKTQLENALGHCPHAYSKDDAWRNLEYTKKYLSERINVLKNEAAQIIHITSASEDDKYLTKKKVLMDSGFKIYACPELALPLLKHWDIFEYASSIVTLGDSQANSFTYQSYIMSVARVLPLFERIIFKMSDGEVDALRNRVLALEKYWGEYLNNTDIKSCSTEAMQLHRLLDDAAISRLKKSLIICASIIRGSTIGEHLGKSICEELIPKILSLIRTEEHLTLFSVFFEQLFKKKIQTVYRYAGVIEKNRKLYISNPNEFLSALTYVAKRFGDDLEGFGVIAHYIYSDIREMPLLCDEMVKTISHWMRFSFIKRYDTFGWNELIPWEFTRTNQESQYDFQTVIRLLKLYQEIKYPAALELYKRLNILTKSINLDPSILVSKYLPMMTDDLNKEADLIIAHKKTGSNIPTMIFEEILNLSAELVSQGSSKKLLLPLDVRDINRFSLELIKKMPAGIHSASVQLSSLFRSIAKIIHAQTREQYHTVLRLTLKYIGEKTTDAHMFCAALDAVSAKLKPASINEDILDKIFGYYKSFSILEPQQFLPFHSRMLDIIDPKNLEEYIAFMENTKRFIDKAINNNRSKMKILKEISNIDDVSIRIFRDFLANIYRESPNNFYEILVNVFYLSKFGLNVGQEIKDLLWLRRSYTLYLSSGSLNDAQISDIGRRVKDVYLFLCDQTGRKPKLDKIEKNISKLSTEHKGTAMDDINRMITDLSITYFSNVRIKHMNDMFVKECGVPLPDGINIDEAANALMVSKNCATQGRNRNISIELLRHILLKDTVPFKRYPEAYPYNQLKNIEFQNRMRSKGVDLEPWLIGFSKTYDALNTDVLASKQNKINLEVREVIEHFKELGVIVDKHKIDMEPLELLEYYKQVKDHENTALVSDISGHLKYIQSMIGQIGFASKAKKIRIYIETDPLKILKEGDVVGGSCLNINGCNNWTTVTDAVDINKRVLYAVEDSRPDSILGRRRIVINDDGEIVQYRTYSNVDDIDLPKLFEIFTIELAKACNAGLGTKTNISVILGDDWYAGTEVWSYSRDNIEKVYKKAA